MVTRKTQRNKWHDFHRTLEPGIAKYYKTEIERVLGISQAAFYRKIKDPGRTLSIADKVAIAKVYRLKKATFLFPELGDEDQSDTG